MSQYRYNVIMDQWIILAAERGRRPSDFAKGQNDGQEEFDQSCPFCPGHERMTPPEVFAFGDVGREADGPGWTVRVVPNKYPALTEQVEWEATTVFDCRAGQGAHEVIIQSPAHHRQFAYHDTDHAALILRTLRERYQYHAGQGRVRQICIFNNHGSSSGASLTHPHFQLIGPAIISPWVHAQLEHCRRYRDEHECDVFETVIEKELAETVRLVAANEDFVAVCPFGSAVPFELYVLSRAELGHFGDVSDRMLENLAGILQPILKRLDEGLGNPDYNLVFHVAPVGGGYRGFRWYGQLYPRLSIRGGLELGCDMYINTVSPESAASFYRGEVD